MEFLDQPRRYALAQCQPTLPQAAGDQCEKEDAPDDSGFGGDVKVHIVNSGSKRLERIVVEIETVGFLSHSSSIDPRPTSKINFRQESVLLSVNPVFAVFHFRIVILANRIFCKPLFQMFNLKS